MTVYVNTNIGIDLDDIDFDDLLEYVKKHYDFNELPNSKDFVKSLNGLYDREKYLKEVIQSLDRETDTLIKESIKEYSLYKD